MINNYQSLMSALSQDAGIGSNALLGGFGQQDRLNESRYGIAMADLYNSASTAKPIKKTFRKELQAEIDEWLK